ncbi:DNA polymerase-3 subunit alpha [Weissella uvarum]|uniref:DNA polymerase III subunit alpha n=1 Tax=Weissella uvarum TaxID=1479233 RepID=UPI00196214EF|nr:DNA polymerase III subunit alpha [Weissella uvarum]MBM7617086.1 DNA polymerase-3 subunit alpha [Weissella uvarum]MCM0595382.1 DNA polymerase III subunit alpha [Weissella uvarum]
MVPLKTTSAYSLLKSPMLPQQLVQAAKQKGYSAVALTDINTLYGLNDFYQEAQKSDIKPIMGLTANLTGTVLSQTYPLVFLVENQTGYANLLALSSRVMTQTQQPTLADIQDLLEGLYVVFPTVSELSVLLSSGETEAAQLLEATQAIVPAEHLLIGVSPQMASERLASLRQLAQAQSIPFVAFQEVAYAEPQDHFALEVIEKIGQGEVIQNIGQVQAQPAEGYLPEANDWANAFNQAGLSDAVAMSDWLAEHSFFEPKVQSNNLPSIDLPADTTPKQYLQQLAQQGLMQRVPDSDEKYQERLAYELSVIDELGFDDYFLIVWDVMNYMHQEDIRTGPGRGSVAGSLVAYALGITDVDPIQYDLLFERFLNPERAQMPDIDIDIPDNRREQVLNYLHEKYGHEQVAQIITFSTMSARAVIRDVARVFGLNPSQIDQLSKTIPRQLNLTLDAAYQESQAFRNALYDLPVDGELLFDTAKRLEGLPRNASLHAAGVVLSATPIQETIPVQLGEDGRLVTQFPKGPVEALGMLKMDFLALSNLNILDTALREVQKQTPDFNINEIDLNDPQTLALFQKGQTNGVFQFESAGMKNMLRQMHPDSFEDIVAANALFRPGPSQNIGHFIARKHGQEAQAVPDPSLEEILAPTYGIIVYQEQVMRVAEQFAGFSLGQADLLRRAMSKKDSNKLATLKDDFVAGAIKLGHTEQLAQEVYSYIETFAQYGFNRSHAVAYSKLAFQIAYVKVHYPLAFFKAVLNDAIADKTKISTYIAEARSAGVTVKGPSINQSWQGYSVNQQGQLQMGLASISGLRRDFREAIITARQEHHGFADLTQFIGSLPNKYRKVAQLEPLVYVGAFDEFNSNRRALLESLQAYLDAVGLAGDSMSLFKTLTPKVRDIADFSDSEKLAYEHDYLGVYLSGHPIEAYLGQAHQDINTLVTGMEHAKLIGYIQNVKVIRTKKGDQMAFVDVMDLTGEISITVFPRLFQQLNFELKAGVTLLIEGKVEQQRGRDALQVIANHISLAQAPAGAESETNSVTGRWFLRIPAAAPSEAVLQELQNIISQHHGTNPVLVVDEQTGKKIVLADNQRLDNQPATQQALQGLLGQNNVVFKASTE